MLLNSYRNIQIMEGVQYGQYTVPPVDKMVNFGVGQPSPEMLPLDKIQNSMKKHLEMTNPLLLQYGDIPGYKEFLKSLSNFLSDEYEDEVKTEQLLLTNGITGAISLIFSLLDKDKTVVFVEDPTYFLMVSIIKDFSFKHIETIQIKEDGIDTDELEEKIKDKKYESYNKVLYTIPVFHNPTGYSISHNKKEKLGKIADENNLTILADEVYQMLYFEEKPPKPMCYYTDKAVSIGSFSKILAPSLRLGWIQTNNKEYLNMIKSCGILDSSGCVNPICASIVHQIIESGDLRSNINDLKEILKNRCYTLCSKLDDKLF